MNNSFHTIIGLEIHVELKTNSKMFCGCKNDPFGAPGPNYYTCPVCLGLPGALPVPNKKAIDWTIMLGHALNCSINLHSKFDRKHYFYPDLPKGYQISQYDLPFAYNGFIDITDSEGNPKRIRIRRVHLEEDTGKLQHTTLNGKKVSLVDFNRSSVPLVEVVTEPDLRNSAEAKEFAKKLHKIVRHIGVSDADMEKGTMRLEANVSLSSKPVESEADLPAYKVELKNINSFKYLSDAIDYEVARHAELLTQGKTVIQETRGWSEDQKKSISQRIKEEANDYRYFPDPDLPPIRLEEDYVEKLKSTLPVLPDELINELTSSGVSIDVAEVLTAEPSIAAVVMPLIRTASSKKDLANWLARRKDTLLGESPEKLVADFQEEIGNKFSDEKQIEQWITEVVSANPKVVDDYRSGKDAALYFLVGQIKKLAKTNLDMELAITLLKKHLSQ